jgi:DNA-binding NtrC family response regulator
MIDIAAELTGTSPAVQVLQQGIEAAARSDAKVLITGESGTGKEITARLIHGAGRRRAKALVPINCAGIPESLLESELFGHERGSFTGAVRDRGGMLEAAHGGTAFLDEIGEMTLRMQGLLLRFLETGEIQRVGSDRRNHRVDVRIVAATNRDLLKGVERGDFRLDLFYRLNVIHLRTPPLRDRREDLPALLDAFLSSFCRRYQVNKPSVTREAMAALGAYHWPGNVRELKNVAERLVVCHCDPIGMSALPPELTARFAADAPPRPPQAPVPAVADDLYDRIVNGGESFWTVVYAPFMNRDLTRDQVRAVIRRGLEQTRGSYTLLVRLLNMPDDDYKRLLNFLRKHNCQIGFQEYRRPVPVERAPALGSVAV